MLKGIIREVQQTEGFLVINSSWRVRLNFIRFSLNKKGCREAALSFFTSPKIRLRGILHPRRRLHLAQFRLVAVRFALPLEPDRIGSADMQLIQSLASGPAQPV